MDSCLCDACFRHVDRRANCPSYKKRLSEPSKSTETEEPKDADGILFQSNRELTWCQVLSCKEQASQSLCSKWAQKMRRTLAKYVRMNFENTSSMAFLPICDKHYDDINQLLVCIVCNRRLKRNNCYFMNQVNGGGADQSALNRDATNFEFIPNARRTSVRLRLSSLTMESRSASGQQPSAASCAAITSLC